MITAILFNDSQLSGSEFQDCCANLPPFCSRNDALNSVLKNATRCRKWVTFVSVMSIAFYIQHSHIILYTTYKLVRKSARQ